MLFTGIVEEMGTVTQVENLQREQGGATLTIAAQVVLEDVRGGDSIAVNGTCLTVTHFRPREAFVVQLAPETLRCTNLGELRVGGAVNLERSLAANARLGGHIVQGHVDTTGRIVAVQPERDSLWFTVQIPPDAAVLDGSDATAYDAMTLLVPKGYVSVDGTSLTVCAVNDTDRTFTFMLVPYTQQHIVLPRKRPGDRVNIEFDIAGKYLRRFLTALPAYAEKMR